MTCALVFPGQGSQYAGMGQDLAEAFPEAREIFERADETLGFSLSRLCFEGPAEELVLTENTQPAILTVSVALLKVLQRSELKAQYVAGHSLGEYTALVAAGALEFETAVRLVRERGRFMQEAVPVGEGTMAAVIGLELADVDAICREAAQGQVLSPANINAPGQIVIAGHTAAVQRGCELARQRGARRALPLPVSAPFHCELMRPAQERLSPLLMETEFLDLEIPLVNNVDAAVVTTGIRARDGLIRQVTGAVRWTEVIGRIVDHSVLSFVEVGPGRVLSGLIRKTAPQAQTQSIGNREQVEAYV